MDSSIVVSLTNCYILQLQIFTVVNFKKYYYCANVPNFDSCHGHCHSPKDLVLCVSEFSNIVLNHINNNLFPFYMTTS